MNLSHRFVYDIDYRYQSCTWRALRSAPLNSTGEAILFIHPANLSSDAWRPVMELLPDGDLLLAPDLRGHATSEDRGALSVTQWADDCMAFLDIMGVTAVHLVGASVGAAVAVELATRRECNTLSLTTFGGAFLPDSEADPDLGCHPDDSVDTLRNRMVDHALPGHSSAHTREMVLDAMTGNSVPAIKAIWRAALQTDVRPLVKKFDIPCCVVVGGLDKTCPPEESRWFAAQVGADLIQLDEIGHLPMLEAPETAAALVAKTSHLSRAETAPRNNHQHRQGRS